MARNNPKQKILRKKRLEKKQLRGRILEAVDLFKSKEVLLRKRLPEWMIFEPSGQNNDV